MPIELNCANMSQQEFDEVCRHCGICCGSTDGDPCIYLAKNEIGHYYCLIYPFRIGERITVKGNRFRCIPIEAALEYAHIKKVCAYTTLIKKK